MFVSVLYFTAGAAIASIVTFLIYRSVAENQSASLLERLQQQTLSQNLLLQEKQELQIIKEELIAKAARAESRIGFLEEKLFQQKEELNKIGESFKFEFRNLAQNILDEKAQKFTEVNEEKMKAILDPLKKDIGIFKQKVEDTYDKESKERFSLGKEIERLVVMTQQVSAEANNLTTALKGNNKCRETGEK